MVDEITPLSGPPPGPGGNCPKCSAQPPAVLSLWQYVRDGSNRTNPNCYNCPATEHLHVACASCGFTITVLTADNTVPTDTSHARPTPKVT